MPTRVEIDNDVSGAYTVLDVYAADRVGLLFTITNCLYHLWLQIHLAKITTMVDQVLDVFYVTDAEGRKIEDPAHLEQIRRSSCGRSRPRRGAPPAAGASPSGGQHGLNGAWWWRRGGGASAALDGSVDSYLDHLATRARPRASARSRPTGAT